MGKFAYHMYIMVYWKVFCRQCSYVFMMVNGYPVLDKLYRFINLSVYKSLMLV